jgi:hypothetical protein
MITRRGPFAPGGVGFQPACLNGFLIPAIDQAAIPCQSDIFPPGAAGIFLIARRISPCAAAPGEKGYYLPKAGVFVDQRCVRSLQGRPPLLYEAHRRKFASI